MEVILAMAQISGMVNNTQINTLNTEQIEAKTNNIDNKGGQGHHQLLRHKSCMEMLIW